VKKIASKRNMEGKEERNKKPIENKKEKK